ncbi:MAG: hypothetical protein JJE39_01280 [Vicinamibacteria bacterium]|nr:hypothetical protein [Vicinamibacteria bacterium]
MPFASLTPEATFEIPGPRDFAASGDAMWISSRSTGVVIRLDPQTNKVVATISGPKTSCVGSAADFSALLIPQCGAPGLSRIDTKTNAVMDSIATDVSSDATSIATGIGSIWILTDGAGTLARIDPLAGVTVAEMYTPPGATSVAFGEGGVWVASPARNLVTRLNPYNNLIVESIAVPNGPSEVAAGEGSVWSWNRGDGSVSRIDPQTNAVITTIALDAKGGVAGRIAVGEGSLWVATPDTALTRIDIRTNRVAQIFTGRGGGPVAVAHGSVWIGGSATKAWRLDPRRIEATRPPLPPGPPSPSR